LSMILDKKKGGEKKKVPAARTPCGLLEEGKKKKEGKPAVFPVISRYFPKGVRPGALSLPRKRRGGEWGGRGEGNVSSP